jgi:hypothetical protein
MAYENIKSDTPGFCCDGQYFYIMKGSPTNMLIQKTSYGDPVMTYPFSHEIDLSGNKGGAFLSLQFDGINFWSLEKGDGTAYDTQKILRRWRIENFMCVLKDSWLLVGTSGEKMSGKAFAIENYYNTITHASGPGTGTYPGHPTWSYEEMVQLKYPHACFFQVSDRFYIISESENIVEEVQVGAIHDYSLVGTAAKIQNNFYEGDKVILRRDLYYFNNASPSVGDSGAALYWYAIPFMDVADPTVLQTPTFKACHESGIYNATLASTFITASGLAGINQGAYIGLIAYVRGQQLLFKRPNLASSLNYPGPDVHGTWTTGFDYVGRVNQEFKENVASMIMDTAIKNDRVNLNAIYDLGQSTDIVSCVTTNIYRLQTTYTYGTGTGMEGTFVTGPYNYVVSVMQPMVTSIGLIAEPALVVANGYDKSYIWATVRDQYGAELLGKRVVFGLSAADTATKGYFVCPEAVADCIPGSFNWLDGTPHYSAEIMTGSQSGVTDGQAVIEWRAGTKAGMVTIVAIVQP